MFDRTYRDIGLLLLKTAGEEFLSSRSDISAVRKRQLRNDYLHHIPGILILLKQILDDAYERPFPHARSISTTVSPTREFPGSSSSIFSPQSARIPVDETHLQSNSLLSRAPPRGTMDSNVLQTCMLVMEIFLQLFSWIPLSELISPPLLETLLKFSQLNDTSSVTLGIVSMGCVEEMVTRKWSPPQFNECLILIFRYIFDILKYLTDDSDATTIDDLDEEYDVGSNYL